jgi:uncharacterized membrane protein
VSVCKNPSSPACLKFSRNPNVKFCQACGAAASALGILGAAAVPTPAPVAQPAPPPPSYSQAQTGPTTRLINVSKPQLNQQALKMGLMQSLQAQRQQRLPATISSGLMAAGGLLLGVGLAIVMVNVLLPDDFDRSPNGAIGFFLGLFTIFVGWAVATWMPDAFKPTGVTAINVLIPVTAVSTFIGQLEDGNLGLPLMFAAALSALVWVLPGTAGRPSLQMFAVAYMSFAVIVFSVQSEIRNYATGLADFDFIDPTEFFADVAESSGTLAFIVGAILLAIGHQLDRKGWSNVATPFVGLGILNSLSGTWTLLIALDNEESVSGSLIFLVAIALGITYIGGYAGRRFSLGLGVWLVSGGLLAGVFRMAGDDPEPITVALLMFIFAAIVSFAAFKLEPKISQMTSRKP